MSTVEKLEGYGVLLLALLMLGAFALRLNNPPPDVVRAASAPRAIAVLPEISVPHP